MLTVCSTCLPCTKLTNINLTCLYPDYYIFIYPVSGSTTIMLNHLVNLGQIGNGNHGNDVGNPNQPAGVIVTTDVRVWRGSHREITAPRIHQHTELVEIKTNCLLGDGGTTSTTQNMVRHCVLLIMLTAHKYRLFTMLLQ